MNFEFRIAKAVKTLLFGPELNINNSAKTTGRVFWVMNTSDAGYTDFYNRHPAYEDGVEAVYNTFELAYAAMTTNQNDVIKFASHGGHAVAAMVSIAKNRCHFQSIDVQRGRHYGARSRITMGVTTVATDLAVIQNTGVGNTFKGLKFDSSNTKDESLYAVVEAGEYAYYENCEFYKSTDLDEDASAELLFNGDSAKFKDCTFGSLANAITATGAHPCVLLNRETITGKVCRDGMFEGCLFWRKANGNAANTFVYGSGATDVERMLMFKDCTFINTKLATQTMTNGLHFASAQTEGYVILKDCTIVGVTDFANQTGIMNASGPANAVEGGEVIQAT